MIKINNIVIKPSYFPDGTLNLNFKIPYTTSINDVIHFEWFFDNNEEILMLNMLVKHIRANYFFKRFHLYMPYVPYGRMDRVKNESEVFTLKWFCEIINDMNFDIVQVLDPHSNVVTALLNNVVNIPLTNYLTDVIKDIKKDNSDLVLFFPDGGAVKKYIDLFPQYKYIYGNKQRVWNTNEIIYGEIVNPFNINLQDKSILLVDDVCTTGTTLTKAVKKLVAYNIQDIFIYVTHCENSILNSNLLTQKHLSQLYTTNSLFTENHEKIKVMNVGREYSIVY